MADFIEHLRNRWFRFFDMLDSELLRMYQNLFFYLLSIGAAYCLFVASGPPETVAQAWGPGYFTIWAWGGFLGPLVSIIGYKMKGDLSWAGMVLQLTGDAATSITLGSFVVAVFLSYDWGDGTYGLFPTVAAFLCTLLFILRDVRRLIQVERVK